MSKSSFHSGASNKEPDEPTGKENNKPINEGRLFIRGRWLCSSEGCGFRHPAKKLSCDFCGASREGKPAVADIPSQSESLSGHETGFPSLLDIPSPGQLSPASTLPSNQDSLVDKDDNTSSTPQEALHSPKSAINTLTDIRGSSPSESQDSPLHESQQQSLGAPEEENSTTVFIDSSLYVIPPQSTQPSPPTKTTVLLEGVDGRLPRRSLTQIPSPVVPTPSTPAKPTVLLPANENRLPWTIVIETPRPTTPTPVESTTKCESRNGSPCGYHLAGVGKIQVRLPSSPAESQAIGHNKSFRAQAQSFVPSPTPSLLATPTSQTPGYSWPPSINPLGPWVSGDTRNLWGGYQNGNSSHAHPVPQSFQGRSNPLYNQQRACPANLPQRSALNGPCNTSGYRPSPNSFLMPYQYPPQPRFSMQQCNPLRQNAHCVVQNDQTSDCAHSNPYDSFATSTPGASTPNAPDLQPNTSMYPPETNGFPQPFYSSNQIVSSLPPFLLVN